MSSETTDLASIRNTARTNFWTTMITVHSLFLALGFSLMVTGGKWGGGIAILFSGVAFLGLLLPIANSAMLLAHADELFNFKLQVRQPTRFQKFFLKIRPQVWAWFELGSALCLTGCGVLMLYYMYQHVR